MDIKAKITEKIQRMQDLNREMGEISKKIGVLQEEGRALHSAALEVKGAIEGLAELSHQNDLEAKAAEEKAKGLILPDKTLVAADGLTPIAKPEEPSSDSPSDGNPIEEPAPDALEVQ